MVGAAAGFFEDDGQLERLLALGEPLELVALTAAADDAADARGLPHRTIEDLYDEDELLAAAASSFERVDALADAIDEALGAARGSFSARDYRFQLKILHDTVLHRGLTLHRGLERLHARRVVAFAPVPQPPDDYLFSAGSSLVFEVLPVVARAAGVELETLGLPPGRLSTPAGRRRRRSLRGGVRRLTERRGVRSDELGELTLVTGLLSPDSQVVGAWRRRGGQVVDARPLLTSVAAPPDEGLWRSVAAHPVVRGAFAPGRVDLFETAARRLRHLAASVVPRHVAAVERATRLLDGLGHPIVVASAPVALPEVALFVAARGLGVPSAVHQHGGFVGYAEFPALAYADLARGDAYLCYGEGVARVAREFDEPRPEPVPVGSAALEAQRSRLARLRSGRRRGRRVLYVTNVLMGDQRYFSGHIYPDVHYWRLQREIVARCAAFADVELVVKLAPAEVAPTPLAGWIDRGRFSNVVVVREASIVEALAAADLVLIDSPSTTLLQALLADVPVLVLADERWMRLRDEAAAELRARAVLATRGEAFLAAIDDVLSRDDWSSLCTGGDGFLEQYGTHRGDGRAAERAAAALARLASAAVPAVG